MLVAKVYQNLNDVNLIPVAVRPGQFERRMGSLVRVRMRPLVFLVGLIFVVLALASCGSDSGDAPKSSAAPTATRDADGFTAAEREVVDAAERYTTALLDYQKGDRGVDLTKVATKELADSITAGVKAEFEDKNKVLIGDNKFTAESVEINGDKARVRGCSDFSRVFTVKKGKKAAGVGDKPGAATAVNFGLVREGGQWLVNDPKSETKEC